jgi:hypothetical protein
MSAEYPDHGGIIFGIQSDISIGQWVTNLELICHVMTTEEFIGHVEFVTSA